MSDDELMDMLDMQATIDEVAKSLLKKGYDAAEVREFLEMEGGRIEAEIEAGEFDRWKGEGA